MDQQKDQDPEPLVEEQTLWRCWTTEGWTVSSSPCVVWISQLSDLLVLLCSHFTTLLIKTFMQSLARFNHLGQLLPVLHQNLLVTLQLLLLDILLCLDSSKLFFQHCNLLSLLLLLEVKICDFQHFGNQTFN